jgi:hypothetical protein
MCLTVQSDRNAASSPLVKHTTRSLQWNPGERDAAFIQWAIHVATQNGGNVGTAAASAAVPQELSLKQQPPKHERMSWLAQFNQFVSAAAKKGVRVRF